MTAQEAIKELNYDETAYGGKCTKPVREVAIEALEKQIPKKPTFVDTRFRHHGRSVSDGLSLAKCYKCPCCNTHLFHVWDDENYCKRCGQLLDWGEQNEQRNKQTVS